MADTAKLAHKVEQRSEMARAQTLSGVINALTTRCSTFVEVAEQLTTLFLSNNVRLTGKFSCANELRKRSTYAVSALSATIEADVFFPYYSKRTRVSSGFEYACSSDKHCVCVHLQPRAARVKLLGGRVYLIGATPSPARMCHVCGGKHDIRQSSCTMIVGFFAIERHARSVFRNRIRTEGAGARVLSTHERRASVLRDCNLRTHLCRKCSSRARATGHVWFRMNGKCNNAYCPNCSSCDCKRRKDGCADYIYMCEGFEHNLRHDDLASAVERGDVISLRCAQYNKSNMQFFLKQLYARLVHALRHERAPSVRTVAAWMRMYEEEVLALCMHERRLADFLQLGRKSFTLSVVNGFVRLPACRTGHWLDGRLICDHDGRLWHIANAQRVVVRSAADVSTVNTAHSRETHHRSDSLAPFIA